MDSMLDPAMPDRRRALREVLPTRAERMLRFTTDTEHLDAGIFAFFLEYLGQLADEIGDAIAGGDADRVCAIGHSIKGMGGSCGAPEISVFGEELEFAARANDLPRCEKLLAALRQWRASFPAPA